MHYFEGKKVGSFRLKAYIRIPTYHSLNINNSCALINVLLCCNRTGWELDIEGPLKLLHVVIQVAVRCCNLQKLVYIDLAKSFEINRPSILINPVISLWILFDNQISFLELKFLSKDGTGKN